MTIDKVIALANKCFATFALSISKLRRQTKDYNLWTYQVKRFLTRRSLSRIFVIPNGSQYIISAVMSQSSLMSKSCMKAANL